MNFHNDVLNLDCEGETDRICSFIQKQVEMMKRDGIVIGLSGGVDSALAAALSVKAVGSENVFGLILPEKESNPISAEYGKKHAEELRITTETIDITPILEEFGTYYGQSVSLNDYEQNSKKTKIIFTAHGFVFNEPMSQLKRKLYIYLERFANKYESELKNPVR